MAVNNCLKHFPRIVGIGIIVPGNDDVTNGVLSICFQESIDCIDPTARFREEELKLNKIGRKLTFAPLDGHWNKEGHRLAAELPGEHTASNSYISGG